MPGVPVTLELERDAVADPVDRRALSGRRHPPVVGLEHVESHGAQVRVRRALRHVGLGVDGKEGERLIFVPRVVRAEAWGPRDWHRGSVLGHYAKRNPVSPCPTPKTSKPPVAL